ncbi:TrmH family RNA methyltransferase [Roseivirga pacifica]|uniref:TrmH family RNA methyltransferase n=1 Tax=Roseivirga pacifica TaxID=1267423 RepID=UPI00227A073B|nr:RNA methyltransferase [Roseivirga pacifica]
MDREKVRQLTTMLEAYVTENKIRLIDQVLAKRTRHLTVVLEDIYHAQNASAVMRTCDCFGIQDLYVTQNLHDYNVNPNVVRGASKWTTLHKYEREEDSINKCIADLKKKKYRIVGTTPNPESASIHTLNIEERTAVIFGTEKQGLSDYAKANVDELIHIPMHGFTESFNISVSAALILNELTSRLHNSEIDWRLTQEEKEDLKFEWYQNIVKRSDLLINIFLKEHSEKFDG